MEKKDIVTYKKTSTGIIIDGKEAAIYQLKVNSKNGMEIKLTNLGACLLEVNVPDKNGEFANTILGFDEIKDYLTQHFGVIGRCANRIANGKFTLEGKEINLEKNINGVFHLHGGKKGYTHVMWDAEEIKKENEFGVKFKYFSKDLEENYPGNLNVEVDYIISSSKEEKNGRMQEVNKLEIRYFAKTDKTTIINLTNHMYFNLSGLKEKNILKHKLFVNSTEYVATDSNLIPTGELKNLIGTFLDFSKGKEIGEKIKETNGGNGYDHCFVISKPKDKINELANTAKVNDPCTGRILELWTTFPSVQLYTANHFGGFIGKGKIKYEKNSGLCLETQNFPDAPNHENFPSPVLKLLETYFHKSIYYFYNE